MFHVKQVGQRVEFHLLSQAMDAIVPAIFGEKRSRKGSRISAWQGARKDSRTSSDSRTSAFHTRLALVLGAGNQSTERKRREGCLHRTLFPSHTRLALALGALIGTLVAGCVTEKVGKEKMPLGVDPMRQAYADSAAVRNTIGALAYYEGMGVMRVRGYGVVVGLGKNGSRGAPKPIYDQLVESLHKQHRFSGTRVGAAHVTPEQMLNDPDTAVVMVTGEIPAAASVGTRFDVAVTALPGTETKSLRGGRLYTAELEMFRVVGSNASISGQVLAKANGPLFMNPFSDTAAPNRANELEATILGGGLVTQDRRVRLVLSNPSHVAAKQIQDRINAYFSGAGRVADATSPSFVQIDIPPEYRDDTGHFLALVRNLYLSYEPQFESARARELGEEMVRPTGPHALISLGFEALGRSAIPVLKDLYVHRKDYVSFFSAAAGLRLGDHVACDAMSMHAQNRKGEYRFQAIRALGRAKGMAAAVTPLRKLLHDEDPRIAVAAYESLVLSDNISSAATLGDDGFVLDVVPTDRPGFVYVKRTESRRLVLFGRDLRCSPPVLYRAPEGSVTITASDGNGKLTLRRMVVSTGTVSPPIPAPLELAPLVRLLGNDADVGPDGDVSGLGLDYGAVVHLLYQLCNDQAINANFILEEPNAADIFGPPRAIERPESDL